MNRPLHTWILFGICLLVVLAAVGWVTLTTLRLDRAQMEAAQQAELEEKVRLALWRMDSSLMPLFIEESARPASAYEAFYGAEQAFTKGGSTYKAGDVLLPSPLLSYNASNVLLHFDFVPGRPATSPQVPGGNQRQLAVDNYVDASRLDSYSSRLENLRQFLLQSAPQSLAAHIASTPTTIIPSSSVTSTAMGMNNGDILLNELPANFTTTGNDVQQQAKNAPQQLPINPGQPQANEAAQGFNAFANAQPQPQQQQELNPAMQQRFDNRMQVARNTTEFNNRGNLYQWAQQAAIASITNSAGNPKNDLAVSQSQSAFGGGEGLFKGVWLGDQLFLVRRVEWRGRTHVQGCWLNWPVIKQQLLASARDLLPAANLQPVVFPRLSVTERMLAGLPVKIIPGSAPADALPGWSPVRTLLATAWLGILLAAVASAVLLHGTLALSERRATFVSSVTHELRTPLTTFKMYSEMLAEGMVKDEGQQRHYLNTLCSESNRLSHLVENVLAYARLERGSARRNVEKVALREVIQRIEPRLVQRAQQAAMRLAVDADDTALATPVHVDVSAVEQILFNLVDNACKYAAPSASEKVIHLEAFSPNGKGKFAMLRVRDHGQGISADGARRLFQPFCKSAHEAAHTAPGVGLGLALCRRLSRSLGGDLRWISSVKNGACFELALPLQAQG